MKICFDFDGVIHSYTSPWERVDVIPNKPTKDCRSSLESIKKMGATIYIHSTRCHCKKGRNAIRAYMAKNGLEFDEVVEHKPVADFYVDDRAVLFENNWTDVIKVLRSCKRDKYLIQAEDLNDIFAEELRETDQWDAEDSGIRNRNFSGGIISMDQIKDSKAVEVLIHRGSNEIGGTCIQLSTKQSSILLDVGQPLSPDSKPIDISKIKADAVLVSHPHQDHFGLLNEVNTNIPVYIGELGKKLMVATKIFIKQPLYKNTFSFFQNRTPFEIGDFKVTPYLVDHSAVDAYGFLIEVHGKRIFYSGDFRAHGRKSKLFDILIKNPPKNIDLLFMEGTMIRRSNEEFPDEDSVEKRIYKTIKNQRNITFLISSSQNIDRIVSVYRACKRTGKTLVIDAYTSWVLEQIKMVSKSTPNIDWDEIGFFADYRQNEILKDNIEYFGDFSRRLYKLRITKDVLRSNPSDYVFFSKMSKAKWIKSFESEYPVNVIYSQWLGYLDKSNEDYYGVEEMCCFKDDPNINFVYAHTSGHATVNDLRRFASTINAKTIVPIHTEYANEYESYFKNVFFINDRESFSI
jgi:ribonuclease J